MHPVTKDFNDKMVADRRRIKGKVQIDFTDPFLDQSIGVVANENNNISKPDQTANAVSEPERKWISLDGSWKPDGTWFAADVDSQVGWWGNQLAGNRVLSFDGVDDYVEIMADGFGTFNNQSFTVETYFYKTDEIDNRVIFSYDYTSHVSPYYSCHIRFANNDIYFGYNFDGVLKSTTVQDILTPYLNKWTHLAVTFTSGSQNIYINGDLVHSTSLIGTITYYNQEVWVGKGNFGGFFLDNLDDIRYWDVVRTQTEIQENMNKELIGNETGLVGYWKFNETSGTIVEDSTANSNNGTIYGAIRQDALYDLKSVYFTTPYPKLTMTFLSRPIRKLKVFGDNKRGEYPVDFIFKLYNSSDVELHSEVVTNNSDIFWELPITAVTEVTKMTIEVSKWSHAGRQVKIMELFTSIQETYTGDDIFIINVQEEREISNGSLPVGNISANEIEIRLNNITNKFDAGNKQSPIYQLLKANRRIRAWLGTEAENTDSINPVILLRSTTAINPETGLEVAIDKPRYVDGGLLVEEGTINELTNDEALFKSGWSVSGSQSSYVTYEFDSVNGGLTCTVNKDITEESYAEIAWGTNLFNGVDITFSVFAEKLVYESGSLPKIIIFTNENNSYSSTSTVFESITGVKRYKVTRVVPTSPTGTTRTRITFPANTKAGTKFEITLGQVEQKSYETSFSLGTRAEENVSISNVIEYEGTIECKVMFNRDAGGEIQTIFDGASTSSSGLFLALFPDGKISLQYGTGSTTVSAVSTTIINKDTWYHISGRWDNEGADIFIDGMLEGSNTSNPSIVLTSNNYIGNNAGNKRYLDGVIDNLRISNKSRTDEEILAAYKNGLSKDNNTVYMATFNKSLYPVEQSWVPMGEFWSGDWNVPENEVWAHTTGRDRMELLRKSTYSTSQVVFDTNLNALAELVLQDAGLTSEEYWVDPELLNYLVPYAWFEPVSHREALRIIAEACIGQAYTDRNGIIRVEGVSFLRNERVNSEINITGDNYFEKDQPVRWSEIANYIEVETAPLRPVSVAEEVYKSNEPENITAGETKTYTLYYNDSPVIEAVASLEEAVAGATIDSVNYYAWGASVTVSSTSTGSFTIVVNGKPLKVLNKQRAIAQDEYSIIDNGRLRFKFPENNLIQKLDTAQTIATSLLDSFKDPRRDMEIDWRGNPALLLGDKITLPDFKNNTANFHIVSQSIEFDGGLNGKLKGRRST